MDQPLSPPRRAASAPPQQQQQRRRVRTPLNLRTQSIIFGAVAGIVLILFIAAGSRGFHWFDAALVGYAVGTVFAVAAIVYKYTFWLARPQTGRYFRRGVKLFFSMESFRKYMRLVPSAIFADLLTQQFIRKRGLYRWITHQCIFWGVVLSCLITFPLTFGWLRFTQSQGFYNMWVWGFPTIIFPPYSIFGFFVYHALVWTSLLMLVGLVLAFHRHFHDLALIAVQRFRYDLVPLALLFAIGVSGLALVADYSFFNGQYYYFISLSHEAVVVLWLISLPFGKFFHILERPATVGVELYWRNNEDGEPHACPRCGKPFVPQKFVSDLKRTLYDIGENYSVQPATRADPALRHPEASEEERRDAATAMTWWQDFCPDCKRIMRAEGNLAALGRGGNRFL